MTSARKKGEYSSGIAHLLPIVVIVVVVGIIIVLVASGSLTGSFSVTRTDQAPETQDTSTGSTQPVTQPIVPTQVSKPKSSAVASLTQTYSSESFGFSVNYPEGWTADDSSGAVLVYVQNEGAITGASAAVILTTSALGELAGSQLSTIADLNRMMIGSQFTGAVLGDDYETKVGNQDAHVYEFAFADSGVNYIGKLLILIDETNQYLIITTTGEPTLSQYESTLEAIVDSFQLLGNPSL